MSRDRTSFAPNHTNEKEKCSSDSRVIGAHADPGGAGYTPGCSFEHDGVSDWVIVSLCAVVIVLALWCGYAAGLTQDHPQQQEVLR